MDIESIADFHNDGQSGAVEGLSPLDRVNRIHFMLDGLQALATIFDGAMHAPDDHQFTTKVWTPALYLVGMIAKDAHFEVSALHAAMRDTAAQGQREYA